MQLSSLIYLTRSVPALAGMFISKALVSHFGETSYAVMFYSSCVLIIISSVLFFAIQEEKQIRKDHLKVSEDDDFQRYTEKSTLTEIADNNFQAANTGL